MASPGAILRASKATASATPRPSTARHSPGSQQFSSGRISPLARDLAESHGYANAYGPFLPRPPETFTQGAFGPFSPIMPVPVDEPPESAERPEPRRYEYEVGWNLPVGRPGTEGIKLADFSTLKTLADLYSVARSCIQLRKSELTGLDWDIVPTRDAAKAYHGDHHAMRDFGERRAEVVKFFRHPDPDYFSFSTWLNVVLEEIFVFDALSLLLRPKRGRGMGKGVLGSDLDSIELLNGATVRPLIDIHGATPRPPAPAYQQFLYGVPRTDLMTMITERDIEESGLSGSELNAYTGDQLLYLPMVPRRWTPYGFPPIERALIPVMSGLQKQGFQLDYFREGTVPAVYISPGDPNMTPNQMRELQDALNAFAGDPAWHHKIIILPPGSRVDPQKPADLADQFDEIIMTQVTMAFDVQPMELGIVPTVSSSAAVSPFAAREMSQSSKSIQQRKSTKPLMKFLCDIFNAILVRVIGQDDMKFTFAGLEDEQDQGMVTDLLVKQVQNGLRSVDEARDTLELQPWGLPETSGPVVFTPMGPIPFGSVQQETDASGASKPGGISASSTAPTSSNTSSEAEPSTQSRSRTPRDFLTPGHSQSAGATSQPRRVMASGGSHRSTAPDRQKPGGQSANRGGPVQVRNTKKLATKEEETELEILTRHLRKGREIATWKTQHLPLDLVNLISEGLLEGLETDLAIDAAVKHWNTNGPRWPGWRQDVQLAKAYVRKIIQAFDVAIRKSGKLIESWWEGSLATTRIDLVHLISGEVQRSLQKVLKELWREAWYLGDRSAEAVATDSEPGLGNWKPGDPRTAGGHRDSAAFDAMLASYGITVVQAISSTGTDDLVQAVSKAVTSGETWQELAGSLEKILLVPSRAEKIARTEVSRAVSAAAMERYKHLGVSQKEWVTSPDRKVCKICQGNEAEGAVPLSAPFSSGVLRPPGHPVCRCVAVPMKSATKSTGKVSKESVDYRKANGTHTCGNCDMYSNHNCTLVAGHIEPGDVCDRWEPEGVSKGGTRIQVSIDGELSHEPDDEGEEGQHAGGGGAPPMPTPHEANSVPDTAAGIPGGQVGQLPEVPSWRWDRQSKAPGLSDLRPVGSESILAKNAAWDELDALEQHLRKGRPLSAWDQQHIGTDLIDLIRYDLGDGQSITTSISDAKIVLAGDIPHGEVASIQVQKDASNYSDPNEVDAEHVYSLMLKSFPPRALEWVRKIRWIGPVNIPHDRIDYDDEDKWAASHQPGHINEFVQDMKAGTKHLHPVIMIQPPDKHKVRIVDGHHRTLAYRKMGKPVKSYVGFIPQTKGPWDETHTYQFYQGADPRNK